VLSSCRFGFRRLGGERLRPVAIDEDETSARVLAAARSDRELSLALSPGSGIRCRELERRITVRPRLDQLGLERVRQHDADMQIAFMARCGSDRSSDV
jgi:hypothetical protein